MVSPAGTGIGRSAGGGYVAIADPTLWDEEPAPGELPYCGSGLTRVTVRLRSPRARILAFFYMLVLGLKIAIVQGRPRLAMGGKVLLLMDGDSYNLRTREVLSLSSAHANELLLAAISNESCAAAEQMPSPG